MRAKFININEELIGMFRTHYDFSTIVEVYKNPQSLRNLQPWVRGFTDKDGNLYVADSQDVLHHDVVGFLTRKKGLKDDFVDWQRFEDSNKFYLAEGYDLSMNGLEEELDDEQKEKIKNYSPVAASMHPWFEFIWDRTILSANNYKHEAIYKF